MWAVSTRKVTWIILGRQIAISPYLDKQLITHWFTVISYMRHSRGRTGVTKQQQKLSTQNNITQCSQKGFQIMRNMACTVLKEN
jgi:hypothetical protein